MASSALRPAAERALADLRARAHGGRALLINLVSVDWGSYDRAFFAASVVLVLVGFSEKMANRGLLVVGLRSRLVEGWVWFISTALSP